MKLFDDINRDYMGVASEAESDFPFLNRSDRPYARYMRGALETWFADYPDSEDKRKLRSEFRSDDNSAHKGALFELYCYTLLRRQGFDVKLHQIADERKSTRPDFLVSRGGEKLFYLEVTVSADGFFDAGAQKRLNELYDGINERLTSPDFLIGVEVDEAPPSTPPVSQIVAFLEEKLRNLDPEDSSEVQAQWSCCNGRWEVDFWAFPRTAEQRGESGIRPLGQILYGGEIEPEKPLLRALKKKAGHYGAPDLPFVVAVNATDDFTDYNDVEDALLGRKVAIMDTKTKAISFARPPKGQALWIDPGGQHKNRRVSAVFVAFHVKTGRRLQSSEPPALWHNPWANKPLNPDLWQGSQKLIDQETLVVTVDLEGEDPLKILGIDSRVD